MPSLLLAGAIFSAAWASAAPLITEFMASNASTIADENGDYSDWLEIHNPDATAVSLAGWHLTDSASNKTKWTIPEGVSIPANGYLLVWASNKNRGSATTPLHTNFALSAGGEYLGLIQPDGTVVSEYAPTYPPQSGDTSYGVTQPTAAGEEARRGYFATPTPNARNGGADTLVTLGDVTITPAAGAFAGMTTIEMAGAGEGQVIRYTLTLSNEDGADAPAPTSSSNEYKGPVVLNESAVIKAAVFAGDIRGAVTRAHFVRIENAGGGALNSFSSRMPIIILDNHGLGEMIKDDIDRAGWLHVYEVDANGEASLARSPDLSTPMDFKVRGSSSALFPKKGFNLELKRIEGGDLHAPLLGMPENDRWSVIAPWNFDPAFVRNAYLYSLSNRIGRWAPRVRFAEAFLNDNGGPLDSSDYHGVVLVTDRILIHPNRVAVTDPVFGATTEPEITGGYIIKIDTYDPDEYSFQTSRGVPFDAHETRVVVARPKLDDLSEAQRTYVRNYIQGLEDALHADRADNFAQRRYLDYIDRDSWVDYHLLQVFSGNADALWRSFYMYKDRGGKLFAGPQWDFDRAMGANDSRVQRWDIWTHMGYGNEPGSGGLDVWSHDWWAPLVRDPEFQQSWIDRWQAYRRGVFADEHLEELAWELSEQVDAAAAARDATRWPENTSRFAGGFAGEIEHLATWMRNRAGWIDQQFVAAPTLELAGDDVRITPPAGAQLIYTLDGRDPRALNGARAEGVVVAEGPIQLPAMSNFRVRSYNASQVDAFPGSPWSSTVTLADMSGEARLINVSSRGFTGTGENVLIAGLYVAGEEPSRFLIRAVGPALSTVGVDPSLTLADPVLRVMNAEQQLVAENHKWAGEDIEELREIMASVGAFDLDEKGADAALVTELKPGAYTVVISNSNPATGISLAEIYQIDRNGSRPVNLSTRARVRPDHHQLIGGVAVLGDAPKRLLIRAIGPGLTELGVSDVLADPVLNIHHGQEIIATSDDWESTDEMRQAMASAGAFALADDSKDAALVLLLPPGNYTARVSGKGDAEGVALVEVYELPE